MFQKSRYKGLALTFIDHSGIIHFRGRRQHKQLPFRQHNKQSPSTPVQRSKMQFPVGLLLLLTSTFLLQVACFKTSVRFSSAEEDDASAISHIGEVVMTDGDETEPYVEKSDRHNGTLEAIMVSIEEELSEDGVEKTENYEELLIELAKEYENGTRKGVPTYHHSPLDMANPRDRRTDKRQAYPASYKWEKGIVPYKFNDSLPKEVRENAISGMKLYEKMTCLRFQPWSDTVYADFNLTTHDAFVFFESRGGCWSGIGAPQSNHGPAHISTCTDITTGLHELAHRLGFHHEQSHPKRDIYLTLHPENVEKDDLGLFYGNTMKNALGASGEVRPYDYGSKMHYSLYTFSANEYRTLELRDKRDYFLVSNDFLGMPFSHYDWMGINKYYECADKCPAEKKLQCQNDGYLTEHCECACPQGFSGQVCERLINSDCGGIFELSESNLSVNISSPGYPQSNITKECMWYIKSVEKGKTLVLDIHDLELRKEGEKTCLESLEVRRTLIAQPGERFCGKGARTSISYPGFIILILRPGNKTGLKSGFSSSVRLVSEKEQCYSTADSGSSYRGKVDYSQLYHKCIPWEEAQHCEVNLFSPKYTHSGLSGHSYCRNPNNLLRPWCYVDVDCSYDFCDACGVGQCYDINADCVEVTTKDPTYCSTDMGFRVCHKTCNFCGRGHEKPVSSCSKPDMTGKNAVIDPSHENQSSFKFGEKLKMDCKEKINDELITRQLTCTTDGKFVGDSFVCCNHQACNDGWTNYKDSCYKLVKTKTRHSIFDCEEAGASLAAISDDAENNFVEHLIGRYSAWIGYSNLNTGKKFVWTDGVQRTYTNWRPKEPSFGEYDNCTIMEVGGTWDDINCLDLHMGVCKKHNEAIKGNCSCADEYPKCAELMERDYKFCSYEYSSTFCRSSCGLCGTVNFCKNPGPIANTFQKTTNESITNGNYFDYECSGSGYNVASGNLGRVCLKDGTLSGSALVCKPYVGHEAIQYGRVDKDRVDYMYMERSSAMTFNKPGAIIGWRFFSNYPGKITMMVVRPFDGHDTKVVVVWMKDITVPNAKSAFHKLAESDSIRVETGDIIAWYYLPGSKPSIPFTECSSKDARAFWYGPGPYTVGHEPTGTETKCREYSVGAVMDYGPLVVCKKPETVANALEKTPAGNLFKYECIRGYQMLLGSRFRTCLKDGTLSGTAPVCVGYYIGHDPVYHRYTDFDDEMNYTYMERSVAKTFKRRGTIKAWALYSTSAADITMMVFRPLEGSDTKFKIVGMNPIKTPNGTAAVIPVATADRISVEAGDVIAWYYMPGSDPTIPFTWCWPDFKTLWFGPGSFKVGQETSGTVTTYRVHCRQYSIGAVMDSEAHFGHDTVQHSRVDTYDTMNYMYIERSSSMIFDRQGRIKEWILYSNSASKIKMAVLRPLNGSDTKFTVVGMNKVKTPNGKAAVIPVATADRISVEAGDIIAWYYIPGYLPTIPFRKCDSDDVKVLFFGPAPLIVGEERWGRETGMRGPCRQYSIGAVLENSEAKFGHDAVQHNRVDFPSNINYMYIERSSPMTFDRQGTIKAWKLYSSSAAEISMGVIRPLEGSDTKFKIVGMNPMKTPNGTAAVIPVPTADRISVEAGDIIAWHYMPGSDPTIPFSACSASYVKILWFGPGPFSVGQEVSGTAIGNRGWCRRYSIGAVMEYHK